ncbi:hypothetical protein A2V68_02540 [candidate division Kazan bacterium RBG_13_50_9]|uniref:RNase H type-1 domain-containing protein n=1 Tax=candidate division Kazan bacterium RBG_13_50_9 TaxID=1798535 RepID=A0A1F4NT61_UNCK3|nr:MAG: hypothetical protein A2V68_02540 [candidate division Kazan bacterium RBG_13_50_9]
MANFTLYTDGGARGNPGPAAAGGVIYNDRGKEIKRFSSFLGTTTNNQAEYQALILGLGRIKKVIGDEHLAREVSVKAHLDSELIVRQLSGEYRVKNRGLKPLVAKVEELAANFRMVKFTYVPREKNCIADMLVNQELDRHS